MVSEQYLCCHRLTSIATVSFSAAASRSLVAVIRLKSATDVKSTSALDKNVVFLVRFLMVSVDETIASG